MANKFKEGEKVIIDLSRYNDTDSDERQVGITPHMREYDGKTAVVIHYEGERRVSLNICTDSVWHSNWLKKIPIMSRMAVDLDDSKEIQRLIKNNIYEQIEKDDFDGRAYKDLHVIYIQQTKEKDAISKEKVILRGMLFTEKLEDIDRNNDFFVFANKHLKLYGNKRLEMFKDVPILKMAEPEQRKKEKPVSLYNIKSKELDSDILIAIKKLIERAKACDIDADVYFMLNSIRSKSELRDTVKDILVMSHRKYDEKAHHIFEVLNLLIESLP